MTLWIGTGMSRVFYDWIATVVSGSHRRLNGSVIQLDHHSKIVHRREFIDAVVTDIEFPDLDVSSNREAMLRIIVQPERVREGNGGVKGFGVYASSMAKAWSVNRFRMRINGLDTDCAHITKITGLSVKYGLKSHQVSQDRFPSFEPTKVTFSNIMIELPLAYGKEFQKWFQDKADPRKTIASEKDGLIGFLAPGSSTPYFEVSLKSVGTVSMAKTAHSHQIRLSYESMKLSVGGGAVK